MRKTLLFIALSSFFMGTAAQEKSDNETFSRLKDSIQYRVDIEGSFSKGKTPLWLNANKYGLSSLEKNNGYIRAAAERPISVDYERKWGIGYGLDVAVPFNYTSNFVVQQAYVQARWLKGMLTIGAKEEPMALKNNQLSSGSQTLGINARPVPQVRISLPDYWTIPFTKGLLQLKGHISYGMMTDQNWQHDFTNRKSKYADNLLYHSKAGFLRIGDVDRFKPFSVELGLEMATVFGGKAYHPRSDGSVKVYENKTDLSAFWHAFFPGGAEINETVYKNVEGNQLGSWLIRFNWDEDLWDFHVYGEKFFDDHSAMLFVDYDGFGIGDNWQKKEKRRYLFYDIKDMMLGAEFNFKYDSPIKSIVFEYLYTKYQSGPIYHDHTPTINDHIGGSDDFYNHYIYTGWQHWGQNIGNPLYMSPIYNTDGQIKIKNNRFSAVHLGLSGILFQNLNYRVLATYQDGLGTYDNPYYSIKHNVSLLAEAEYKMNMKPLRGWSIRGAFGADMGSLLGHNYGFQITLSKRGLLFK
ncbi:MAG: hypothetical protein J5918_01265 [Prevotella sp.]|nr:hypothetical protein [Prevotella sp.]MBR1621713.1 hypothetical protein [Prevotella sp.]